MDLRPACLDHLHRAIGDRPQYVFLKELGSDELETLFEGLVDMPYSVAPGWGNVHSYKDLLFNLDKLRDAVRVPFLDRLLGDMARLYKDVPISTALDNRSEPSPQPPDSGVPEAGPENRADVVSEQPCWVPSASQSLPDWFDRLLDWAAILANGLGLIQSASR